MNSLRIICKAVLPALLFIILSCNGSEEKTETEQINSDTSASTSMNTATSTINTTPQHMVTVKHRVSNFEKWKAGYDSHDSARLANGLHNYVIGRGIEDSNMVLVALKADDMEKAKAFGKDPGLKQVMQKAGVIGAPVLEYTTMVFQDSEVISSQVRAETTFSVNDWNAWQLAFAEGKQERTDNGIMERAYGHDADDNNKVRLVVAIIDSAKASAYWKSDLLKERRASSGVTGEPKRFLFRVVQRY